MHLMVLSSPILWFPSNLRLDLSFFPLPPSHPSLKKRQNKKKGRESPYTHWSMLKFLVARPSSKRGCLFLCLYPFFHQKPSTERGLVVAGEGRASSHWNTGITWLQTTAQVPDIETGAGHIRTTDSFVALRSCRDHEPQFGLRPHTSLTSCVLPCSLREQSPRAPISHQVAVQTV